MINNGDSAFLILCEELNFTRAAERCFMTQQGLSSHIKKLEELYETKLFLRKPNVELTESGNALRLALLKKNTLRTTSYRPYERSTTAVSVKYISASTAKELLTSHQKS